MKSKAEIFHEHVLKYGGKLNMEKLDPKLVSGFEEFLARMRDRVAGAERSLKGVPPIHFDLISNGGVNAMAFKKDGYYFVGMTTGLLVSLRILFERILANPELLPEIDGARNEVSTPILPKVTAASLVAERQVAPIVPRDPNRRAYAIHLWHEALTFVLDHELIHIIHGHVGYLESSLGLNAIEENEYLGIQSDYALMRQTLEMDSDGIAANQWIQRLRHGYYKDDPDPYDVLPPRTPLNHFTFRWAYAVSTFFRLLGDDTITAAGLDSRTHPPNRARQHITLATALTYVEAKWEPSWADRFARDLMRGVEGVEVAYKAMEHGDWSVEGLDESSDIKRAYSMQLVNYWTETLREKLLPFAFGSLPP
jgi:hypothetical protein